MRTIILILTLFYSTQVEAQYLNISWDDIDRTYLLRLPSQYNADTEYPLVIAMHGGLGSAFNIENQSQLSVKAEEENFIVVYPEGVAASVTNIRTWNAGWCCGMASSNNIDDVGFINTLIDTLIANYSLDSTRIYATGMSNGGFMSYRLACELPERIAAIAPVAASMSVQECNPSRQVPVIHFHSYLDKAIPYAGGIGEGLSSHHNPPLDSVLNVWSSINECQITNDTITDNNQYTNTDWSDCDCSNAVQQYITHDGGHSWPGGMATPMGDPVSSFINANDLMWSFFENHSLECLTTSTSNLEDNNSITIYPNPAKGTIFIESKDDLINPKISIYNINGRKLLTFRDIHNIDISTLATGTYILKIEVDDSVLVKKLIKID